MRLALPLRRLYRRAAAPWRREVQRGAAMGARALWALLAALRAGWCLLPQSGYVHPDEFFQAPEVMAEFMNAGNLSGVDLETLQGCNGAPFPWHNDYPIAAQMGIILFIIIDI
ncbi:hypothetical protein BTVI_154119 [Pitangus sulphuratus]|nr:hypothetical protein BTVI_154119 [Pitangus sulphuratus]